MYLLALDTAGIVAGVSIIEQGRVLYEANAITRYTHSVNLLPMIDEAMARTGLSIKQMNYLAQVVGPGSFTGVRIGVSTVKGMAHGLNVPCIGINGLEALALNGLGLGCVICPIMDARAGQVYGAAFEGSNELNRLLPDEALSLEDYIEKIKPLGERFFFTGDGLRPHQEKIGKLLGEKAVFAGEGQWYSKSANVGLLAWQKRGEGVDYLTLEPYYLRAPQAERQRLEKEKQQDEG